MVGVRVRTLAVAILPVSCRLRNAPGVRLDGAIDKRQRGLPFALPIDDCSCDGEPQGYLFRHNIDTYNRPRAMRPCVHSPTIPYRRAKIKTPDLAVRFSAKSRLSPANGITIAVVVIS